MTVVAIRREGQVRATIRQDERFRDGDVMLVIGAADRIRRLASLA